MILIIIILIILNLLLRNKKFTRIEDKKKLIKKQNKILNNDIGLGNIVNNFLKSIDSSDKLWCYNVFKFFNELETSFNNYNFNEIIIGYNSFKLPNNIINIVNKSPLLNKDPIIFGEQVESEIKYLIKYFDDKNVNNFMNFMEYLTYIYYKNDKVIKIQLCTDEYFLSKKLNNILIYFKGDPDISKKLYEYSIQNQECNNLKFEIN